MTKCAAEDQRFLEFNDAHEIIQGDERVAVFNIGGMTRPKPSAFGRTKMFI